MDISTMYRGARLAGVNDASTSGQIEQLLNGYANGPFGSLVSKVNAFIDGSFNHDAQKAFQFMKAASGTGLGSLDFDEVMANGTAERLADIWQKHPDEFAEIAKAQYKDAGALKMALDQRHGPTAVASNAGTTPAPGAASTPSPAASPLMSALGPSMTALAGILNPAAGLDMSALMKSMPILLGAYAQIDPSFSMAKSFLNATLDILQKNDFFGAGQGNMPPYATIKDMSNKIFDDLASRVVGAVRPPAGPS